MTSARLTALLASLCFLVGLPASSIQKDDPLVHESVNLSRNHGDREQMFYLTELCCLSPQLNLPSEKAKEYSEALFRLASTEQDMDSHALGQKNTVTCLSYVDPEAAMELLPKIDFQQSVPGLWRYEDDRYNAAEKTFVNFLAKFRSQAVDNIVSKAKYLGQTGQYPYFAVARVIDGLPASSKGAVNTSLKDALEFYATETGFYNRDEEFLLLLQSLKSPAVNKDLAVRAVATFVRRLKNDPIHLPGDYYAEIHVTSTGKVFPFTDRNEAFLFQGFRQIRRFDPALAAQLLQQDPKLSQAADKMSYIFGGFVQVSRQAGFSEIRDLVSSIASQPSDVLRAKVQNSPDSWLKAYLLLYEAAGHAKLKAPPETPTPCPTLPRPVTAVARKDGDKCPE